ncbi:DNA/RNA non-specific endonuclease [Rhodococcus phenolicus]|uniref:DNA/RNA non-specific endonuclease n=1 Tax=Rhodococcus phenolicus TaxID=263849 RepID=UPI00083749FB|nr:DNA/RNA non-specific endonuclease [Rhodococcus phenolicus]
MTIISNTRITGSGDNAAAYLTEREHQRRAAARRIVDRTEVRTGNEQVLDEPGGIARADDPERIARRLDRVSRYYLGGDTAHAPTGADPAALIESALERAPSILGSATEDADSMLEKIINTADFVGVRYLDEGVAAARAIGRVHILGAGGSRLGYGTGFLVSPHLLLTNHHVLPDAATASASAVEFDYQDGIDGHPLHPRSVSLDPSRFFVADRERDFTLVAVDAPPEVLAQYGFNRLTTAQGTIVIGEFVTIVQHPRGEKKQIALRENKIVDIPEMFVHYSADTEPGSSGSPVFNDQWEVVALHHASVRAPQQTEYGGFLNEGVRISRILQFLDDRDLPSAQRALVAELTTADRPELLTDRPVPQARPDPADDPGAAATPDGAVTVRVPCGRTVELTVRVGETGSAAVIPPPDIEAISIDPDYSRRAGFDPGFLGSMLPLPGVTGDAARVASGELRYHHFSVVMHRRRRLALFTAVNIDGGLAQRLRRDGDRWIRDPRLPDDEQTGEEVYRDNPLDRGHLVRRLDPAWGPAATAANDDTFHFTNCTPQHHDFNAGSTLWLGLEDYVLGNADTRDLKVSVVTGPILSAEDPLYRGVALPRQYWKVVAMRKSDGTLSATGYLLSQAALLDEFLAGPEEFSFGAYRTYQVPVRRIASMTGLGFDAYVAADPLDRIEASTVARELLRPQDPIL